jgi:DNA-binding transcriptional LysR family regulator
MAGTAVHLRYLRYFVAVGETRNLSRAASQLHIAQPALSRQIRDLERELGVELLQRHPKGVTPTLAGEALIHGAPRILANMAIAFERAAATAAGRRGRVVFGALRAFFALGLPGAVQEELKSDHPEITLVVQDLDPPEMLEQLRGGVIDLGLGTAYAPQDAAIIVAPLWAEIADRALVPAAHALARRRSVTVTALRELPLVVAKQGYSKDVLESALDALRAAGLRSPLMMVEGSIQAAHIAVAAGQGWTLVTRARALAPPEGTAVLAIEGFEFKVMTYAMWRRSERRPVVRTAIDKLLELVRRRPDARVRIDAKLLPPAGVGSTRRSRRGDVPATVEIRHLRALLAVAGAQSIGRAAEQIGVAQPSLSRQLKELEHAVGVPLLERSARGVILTPAGVSLAEDCPALLVSIDQLFEEATRARRGMEGRCVLGAVATTVTSDILTRVLTACSARYPHIQITIEEMASPLQLPALARGKIDLGLAHSYLRLGSDPTFVHHSIVADRVDAAVLSAGHPLAQRRELEAADLADVPFLFMERAFHQPLYDRVFAALDAIGLTPRVDATYDGLQAVWTLAAQGKGWCLGFRSQRPRPPTGTVVLPIAGFDLPWGIDVICRRDERSAAVQAVLSVIRQAGERRPR